MNEIRWLARRYKAVGVAFCRFAPRSGLWRLLSSLLYRRHLYGVRMESLALEKFECTSVRAPRTLQLGIGAVLIVCGAGCAAERPPVVTETEAPWQHRYEVESGLTPEGARLAKPKVSAAARDEGASSLPPSESTGEEIAHVFADVIAFPFRGVGWVVQKIF